MKMHMWEEHTEMRRMWTVDFVNTEEELMSGDFAKVKVSGAVDYDLIGGLI